MLSAHVVGQGRIYDTTVGPDEHGFDSLCACPVTYDCKHAPVPCAKLDALLEHLSELAEAGHRALGFSQFTSFLALVRDRLERGRDAHCYLDGVPAGAAVD